MIGLRIILDGDNAMPELRGRECVHIQSGFAITALPAGLQSGKPSVAIVIDLPDGRYVFAETTLALLLTAADAFQSPPRRPAPRRLAPGR